MTRRNLNNWIGRAAMASLFPLPLMAHVAFTCASTAPTVNASGSCSWQAQASLPWIRITSGLGASGSGIVSYAVSASDGKNRTGSISIFGAPGGAPVKGNATVVVTQNLTASLLPAFMPAAWPAIGSTLITLDENGHETIQFPGGLFVGSGVLAPDPGPGGLASALTYDLDGPNAINPGFPTDTYHNCAPGHECTMQSLVIATEVGPEGSNGFTYTPTADQPGFIPGSAVTYQIVSDTPEPRSSSLVMIAAVLYPRVAKVVQAAGINAGGRPPSTGVPLIQLDSAVYNVQGKLAPDRLQVDPVFPGTELPK